MKIQNTDHSLLEIFKQDDEDASGQTIHFYINKDFGKNPLYGVHVKHWVSDWRFSSNRFGDIVLTYQRYFFDDYEMRWTLEIDADFVFVPNAKNLSIVESWNRERLLFNGKYLESRLKY